MLEVGKQSSCNKQDRSQYLLVLSKLDIFTVDVNGMAGEVDAGVEIVSSEVVSGPGLMVAGCSVGISAHSFDGCKLQSLTTDEYIPNQKRLTLYDSTIVNL
jgi:hypothetical protein